MKILAASDLHGDRSWIEKLAEKASQNKVDLVILCGDLVFSETKVEGILAPFKKRNLKVALIPGNHENAATTNFLTEFYKLYNLHGYYLKLKDISIFGAGGGNIGLYQVDENYLWQILKKSHEKIKNSKKKILVTHLHPKDSLIEKISFAGSSAIRQAIEEFKPDLHLCGHIHEAEGVEEIIGQTKVINVGKKGKILEI